MNHTKLCSEFLSLLYWAMLAANTIGPGTVVTCARAGAEFELHLVWVLIFASLLAFTLQVEWNTLYQTGPLSLVELLCY